MRATKAYIASLGTTGVLLGASLLMLAVVSAVVAFDRWPAGNVSTRVQTLVLSDKPAPIRVSATGRAAIAVARASAGAPAAAPRARAGTPSGVLGRRVTGGRVGAPGLPSNPAKGLPPAGAGPLQPVQDTTSPIIDTISNPGTTTGAVADGAQAITDAAGVSLGRISPQVGGAVVSVGQGTAQAIREIPLPQHLVPGH